MPITFPASPSDGDVYTNTTTGVKYIYNNADGVWKTQVFPTNTDYLQLTGGTLTGNLSLGTNDLTAQDINSTTLTTTGAVTVGNGLTVSAGNVVMSNGAGIDFSATADGSGTLDNELFDNYEEGEWIPAYAATTTNPSVTFTEQYGRYTRIGNVCHVEGRLVVSTVSGGSGDLFITGLPFNPAAAGNPPYIGGALVVGFAYLWSTNSPVNLLVTSSGGDKIFMYYNNNNGKVLPSNLQNGTYLNFSGCYKVD